MDRVRAWLAVSPLVGAGVLVAHVGAYRVTGAETAPYHSYLHHAPQVLVVLAVVGACLAALGGRAGGPSVRLVPAAALVVFLVQEHLERFVHAGELPLLVSSPAFLVGLLLQLPVALCAWALARWLLDSLPEAARRPAKAPRIPSALAAPATEHVLAVPLRPFPGRGPPLLLRR